jgi:hypothetical protein
MTSHCSACRHVYRCGSIVVKFETTGFWGQCKDEWTKWKKIPSEDRRHFAKLYKLGKVKSPRHHYTYTVQEYIKQRPGPRSEVKSNEAKQLFKRLGIGDFHEGNWLVDKQNRVRIIDLGISY